MNAVQKPFVVVALFAANASVLLAAEPGMPRYQFEVGQELTYFDRSAMVSGDFTRLSAGMWQFWVIGRKPDQTWQIMVRRTSHSQRVNQGGDVDAARTELRKKIEQQGDDIQRNTVGLFEIDQTGRIREMPAMTAVFAPVAHLFCSLPKNEQQAANGWQFHDRGLDELFTARMSTTDANQATVESVVASAQNDCFEVNEKITAKFDLTKGLPTLITSEFTQNYAPKGQSNGTIELIDMKKHPDDWIDRFATDVKECFTLIDVYHQVAESKELSGKEIEVHLNRCREKLDGVTEKLDDGDLKTAMKRQLKSWDRGIAYYVEDVETRRNMIGKASPEWKTTDLAGKDYSLNDFEGKVLILDFWYRGCGWCIFAMPQIKEVSEHFKGKPVAVLGMNTDRELSDAEFVIDKLKLPYLNLKAEKIAKSYKVEGFPMLLIIDQQGKVRDVHIGYSPKLKEEVIKSVESLLANPVERASAP